MMQFIVKTLNWPHALVVGFVPSESADTCCTKSIPVFRDAISCRPFGNTGKFLPGNMTSHQV